ncbi:hypothetical protein ACFXB3_12595 [Streptomyces sp. NPDC059447]|uniref:hypothetical protein n=1 Tax=Streptomyces sp. NPDC059447 TaxID=3346834 RepID=UPI0036771301
MFDLLRPTTLLCSFCHATAVDGTARTLCGEGGRLSVTWHRGDCPHLAADRILAADEK